MGSISTIQCCAALQAIKVLHSLKWSGHRQLMEQVTHAMHHEWGNLSQSEASQHKVPQVKAASAVCNADGQGNGWGWLLAWEARGVCGSCCLEGMRSHSRQPASVATG